MELPMAIVVGVLFAGGTYCVLRPNLIRIVLGFGLYSNGVNLLMIACGGYSTALAAPFVAEGVAPEQVMDPLPPDIILTAIVISFAVSALFLTICYRVYQDHGTDDPSKLPQHVDDSNDEPSAQAGVPDVLTELAQPNARSPHESDGSGARASLVGH